MRWSRNHCPPVCKVVERCLGVDLPGALCHSLSGNLSQAGVDDCIIDHFMGHQIEEMRRRYQHLFAEQKRKALEQLGTQLDDLYEEWMAESR